MDKETDRTNRRKCDVITKQEASSVQSKAVAGVKIKRLVGKIISGET